MSRTTTHFLWWTEAVIDRGPVDEPLFIDASGAATASGEGTFSDIQIEEGTIQMIVEALDVEPDRITLINLSWFDAGPPPPPA